MKKIFPSFLMLTLAITLLQAQSAKRYTLFEHFTQASCGPCAQQNPAFSAFYDAHENSCHHIAYHTSWPGVDPMNAANAPEVADRVATYGVQGVPAIWVSGLFETSPGTVNEGMLTANDVSGSPIQITVNETTNGNQRTATINVLSVGNVPAGSYVIRGAVVEKMVNYTTAPGSNGEKDFPNVFRKMLPSSAGDAYTPAAQGQVASFSYTYTLDATWDPNEIYVVAFVQNTATKEILNSGTSKDWTVSYLANAQGMHQISPAASLALTGDVVNNTTQTGSVNVKLTTNAPADWAATLSYNGQTLPTLNETVVLDPSSMTDLNVNITSGSTITLAKYTLTVTSTVNPANSFTKTYLVNNGIWDLVLGNTSDFQSLYTDGLLIANNQKHGEVTKQEYLIGKQLGIFAGLKNIYFNIGWTFPALTTDIVADLTDFLDNGGNLLICGQDIGWDINDATGNSTAQPIKDFYANYMRATYVADGTSATTQISGVFGDAVYGMIPSSAVIDAYAGNMYPEEILPIAPAVPALQYSQTKIAGVRVQENNHKVVYIGVGIEMIGDPNVRNLFVKTTHDWFYSGLIGIDNPSQYATLGQSYPNPSDKVATIPVMTQAYDARLEVIDITGKVVASQMVSPYTENISLSTELLSSGIYTYRIIVEGNVIDTQKLSVLHP